MSDSTDARYMAVALRLARRAEGCTSPNPMVGAVVVKGRRIVGEGYHRRAGSVHAEVEALQRAGRAARGATLYVTLEPCNHHGRTPPCCDAILATGIRRVVAAVRDPNPVTEGRGLARLRRAGVEVTVGVLEDQARRLNEPFFKAMRSGLPLVIAKLGQSLDGKIATVAGRSRWITSSASRRLAHEWRSRVDAILVGIDTVLADDPRLAVRGWPQRPGRPLKVVVDSRLRIPPTAKCLSKASRAPTLIATTNHASRPRRALERRGAEVLLFPPQRGRVPLTSLCRALVRRGVQSVLLEGGGELLASALAERLVDRLLFFIAPRLIGGRTAPGAVGGEGIRHLEDAVTLRKMTARRVGPDLCVEARLAYLKRKGRA
jgi:diaminohydroxyphosphoribosylaminopyrimidine deaminase/5-amino-6-(5-phosphoribosylamino)uracil reductase